MIKKILKKRKARKERRENEVARTAEREAAKKQFESCVNTSSKVKVRELSELMLERISKNIESRT